MRRYVRFCIAGKIYIAISLLLGGVAIFTGNNLLYFTTAVLLGILLSSGIIGRRNIQNIEVSLQMPEEIYAGLPCPLSVTITNPNHKRTLFLIEVTVQGQRLLFPCLQPGKTASQTFFATFAKRGIIPLDDLELFSAYPFHFFIRYAPFESHPHATVFPHPVPCDPDSVFSEERQEEISENAKQSIETDMMGVRSYTEGDSMKQIHWKSSARTHSLKTRLYDSETLTKGQIIDLDLLLTGETEPALSMACYILMESMKTGMPIGMKHGELLFPPDTSRLHKRELLTLLARYDQ